MNHVINASINIVIATKNNVITTNNLLLWYKRLAYVYLPIVKKALTSCNISISDNKLVSSPYSTC